VVEGISAIAELLPFALRGLDTDNNSAFIGETLQGYCEQHRIEWARSRAYHKNEQAWVEQKRYGGAPPGRVRKTKRPGCGRRTPTPVREHPAVCSIFSSPHSSWRANNAAAQVPKALSSAAHPVSAAPALRWVHEQLKHYHPSNSRLSIMHTL
jgi:hypothetical protein